MSVALPVASPCVGVCVLDAESVCSGCGRHIDEIVAWPMASESQRAAIVARSAQRQAAAGGPALPPESRS